MVFKSGLAEKPTAPHSPLVSPSASLYAVPVNAVLEMKDLRVEFPSRELGQPTKLAVDGLNLTVQCGEVFGFLGPTAPGKQPP